MAKMDLASRLRHIIALIHDERHLDADDEYTLLRDDVKVRKFGDKSSWIPTNNSVEFSHYLLNTSIYTHKNTTIQLTHPNPPPS